jgi:Ribosomal RNA adenine dimethylase
MPLHALQLKIEKRIRLFEAKNGIRLNDEVRFIRSWMEKPLAIGAVMPSSKVLARAMARYVDPEADGPVIELGPGTGPVTEALVAQGVAPERLVLVEFDPKFCDILRDRYPEATVVQGDAYQLGWLLRNVLTERAHPPVARRPGPSEAQRSVRAVHLFGGAADRAQHAWRAQPGFGAHLAQLPAGARLGLSPRRVIVIGGRATARIDRNPSFSTRRMDTRVKPAYDEACLLSAFSSSPARSAPGRSTCASRRSPRR